MASRCLGSLPEPTEAQELHELSFSLPKSPQTARSPRQGHKRRPTVSLLLLEAGDSENASSAAARGQ
jgi:hypothetical protein